jgi:hypothetical protein
LAQLAEQTLTPAASPASISTTTQNPTTTQTPISTPLPLPSQATETTSTTPLTTPNTSQTTPPISTLTPKPSQASPESKNQPKLQTPGSKPSDDTNLNQAQMLPRVLTYGAIPFAILAISVAIMLTAIKPQQPKKPVKSLPQLSNKPMLKTTE